MASIRQLLDRLSLPPWPGYALVQRDLVRSLRRVRPFVFLLVIVLLQCYFVANIYPNTGGPMSAVGVAGDQLFISFIMIILGAGAFLLPSVAAMSVAAEREQETYDLVRLTLMRRGTFFLAKAANAWAYFLLFVVASLPIAGVIFFLVGLEVRQVVMSFAVLMAASIALTMIGVAMSCRARHVARALVLAYTIGLFFMGGHVLLFWAFEAAGWLPSASGNLTATLHPILTATLHPILTALAAPVTIGAIYEGQDDAILIALPYYAVLSAVFAWWGWRALHRAETGVESRAAFQRRHSYRQIPDWANPMAVREVRWGSGMQRRGMWFAVILMWVVFIGLSFWTVRVTNGDSVSGVFASVFAFGALCLLAPIFIVLPLTREKDLHNLDMLRMTMLTSRQIVLGKVWGNGRYLVYMLPGLIAGYAAAAMTSARGGMAPLHFLAGMLSGTVCLFFFSGLCAWIGALSSRTSTALVAAYASGFGVGIGLPFLMAILGTGGRGQDGMFLLSIISPFIGCVLATDSGEVFATWFFGLVSYAAMGWFLFHLAVQSYVSGADPVTSQFNDGIGAPPASLEPMR